LIVRVGFPVGMVPAPRPILQARWSLARAFAVTPLSLGLAGGLLVVLVLGGLLVVGRRDRGVAAADAGPGGIWDAKGRVPEGVAGTRSVELVPPEGVRPGQAGLLLDKTVTPLAIAATVVDLATRGYLRVGQVPSGLGVAALDWRLVQLKDQESGLLEYERALLAGLFEGPLVVQRARQHPSLDQGFPGGGTAVIEEGLASVLMSNLQVQFRDPAKRVRSALYEQAVQQGWFTVRPDRARQAWTWLGAAMAVVGVGLTALLAWRTHLGLVPIPIVVGGLALVVTARWLPRRTSKGDELAGRFRGFRAHLDQARVVPVAPPKPPRSSPPIWPTGSCFVSPQSP
jgi:hypothetical protein